MSDETLTPYGAALRRARLRRGMDQETLGRAIGKGKDWVSREEGGRPNLPEVDLYRALCDAPGIPSGNCSKPAATSTLSTGNRASLVAILGALDARLVIGGKDGMRLEVGEALRAYLR